jgi:hypothetical protein
MLNLLYMKRPVSVEILGQKIKIAYFSEDYDGFSEQGLFIPDKKLISVRLNKNWKSTLLHEILHAVLAFSGNDAQLTTKTEEAIISAMENGLLKLYSLNSRSKLIEY